MPLIERLRKGSSFMAKIPSSTLPVCLLALASMLLNIFLLMNPDKGWNQLSWSQGAAEEAEAVASIPCSGHGRAYLDGLVVNGRTVCECNTCFHGPDCSEFVSDCSADAESGDPVFLEPFWMQHAASSALLVAGWHRMSYSFPGGIYISKELDIYIRKAHAMAKNAVTEGKYIVFGSGSSLLLNAAVYALSSQNSSSPSKVVVSTPYYPLYKLQTEYFETVYYEFEGEASSVKNNSAALDLIEFVTSPNNPDGLLKKAVLDGHSAKTIHDHAYYWPHYTAIPSAMDEDVMIFTLSKLTGHAGSRFGWAIIKDKDVYDRMYKYVDIAEMGVSKDAQLRALKLLKVLLAEGNGREIFDFGHKTMAERWKRLNQVVSASRRLSLQEIPPQYCNYLNKVKDPSPAYGWLKCEYEEDTDCSKVLRAAKILGRDGNTFFAENRHARLSLIKRQDDFEQLLHRMNELVRGEVGAAQAM